jgi:hypothetical protein
VEDLPPPPWHGGDRSPSAEELYEWVRALPKGLALRVVEEHLERSHRGFLCWHSNHVTQIESLSDRLRQSVRQRDAAYRILDEGRDYIPQPERLTRKHQAKVEFQLAMIKLGTALVTRASDRLGVTSRR